MRTSVCCWKCDNPLSVAQKRLYNDKYAQAITAPAWSTMAAALSFFASNDGKLNDDYMPAGQAAMGVEALKRA